MFRLCTDIRFSYIRRRSKTLINNLKHSIATSKESELFGQNIYESSNFNAGTETSYILDDFHVKSAYTNADYAVNDSIFTKEDLNIKTEFGVQNAKEFRNKKLKLR